ncbi:hypothetical protein [Spirochaeta cellobiosiphila]|uniref:hypothetical protein n=1 Tax=Spirochaeta cellobiosiphila TaxID=504483 RepID=UPI0003F6C789|nr:hypothetical protein [Spirochaeta cellobiosiphila]
MSYLIYSLENNKYINRFLVSQVHEEAIHGDPVAIEKEANVWEGSVGAASHLNPIRENFIKERRLSSDALPSFTQKDADGSILWGHSESPLIVNFPYSNPFITNTGFWSTSTWIKSVAYTILEVPSDCHIECDFAVSGGASLWLNDKLIIKHEPYIRNKFETATIVLPLVAGENTLIVRWDDFAERDTEASFSLCFKEEQPDFKQKISVGNRDIEAIKAVEKALGDLSCESGHVNRGDVKLYCPNPFDDSELKIYIEGATEENAMVGDLCQKEAVFAPGSSVANLGACEDFPYGYLQFDAKTEVQGLAISYHLAFENFPHSLLPTPSATIEERKKQAYEFLAQYGERNGNRAIAILYAGGDQKEFEDLIKRQITFINNRSDCSDFYMPYLHHIMKSLSDHPFVTKEIKEEIKACILGFRYWYDEPGDDAMWFYSENHALMFHISQLICGELYPNEIFTNSGMTGIEMQKKALALLDEWFEVFFSIGFTEWNSPPYLPIDSLGFASLYAQTDNERMRENAKKGLDYLSWILAVYSLEGAFSTTSGRTYHKELFGNQSNCPSFINWIDWGIGNPSHAGKGVTALCYSDYIPPKEYEEFVRVPKGKALLAQSTHGYKGHADVYTWKTANYILSSANDFRVGERGFQEDPIHMLFSANEHIWVSHPGEHSIFGHARPSYWAGNGTLPRVNQYQSFASAIYNIDPEHSVSYTHIYIPIKELASYQQKDNWIFVEAKNGGYGAIYASQIPELQTYGPYKDREFIVQGRKTIYLFRGGSQACHGSFEEFISLILSTPLTCNELSFEYVDSTLGNIKGSWNQSITVNGKEVEYKGFDPKGLNTWCEEV